MSTVELDFIIESGMLRPRHRSLAWMQRSADDMVAQGNQSDAGSD